MVSPIPSDLKHILKAYDLSSSEKTSGHISIKKGHHWYHWCAKFLNLRGNLSPQHRHLRQGKRRRRRRAKRVPMGWKQQLPPYELRHLSLFPAGILNSLNSTRYLGRHLCHGAAGGTPSVATARCAWVWCANLTMRLRSWQKQGSLCWAPRLDQGLQNSSGPFQKDRGMIEKAGRNAEQTMEHWGNTSKKHQKNKKHKKNIKSRMLRAFLHRWSIGSRRPLQLGRWVRDEETDRFQWESGWRKAIYYIYYIYTWYIYIYMIYIYIYTWYIYIYILYDIYIIWYIYMIYDIYWYIYIYIYDIYI